MSDRLVGTFFHTYENESIQYQGQVLSRVSGLTYLVQLYEWLLGTPSEQRIESAENMAAWKFYDAADDWRYEYELYVSRKAR